MGDDLLTAVGLVAGVVVTAFVVLTIVGVVLLARRARRGGARPAGRAAAGAELLRADELLRDADDELAFAAAQFGDQRTAGYRAAVESARAELRRAFALQQRIDDPSLSERRRGEATREVRAVSLRVQRSLETERERFVAMRGAEAGAGAEVEALRARLAELRGLRATAAQTQAELEKHYTTSLVAPLADNTTTMDASLTEAEQHLTATSAAIASSRVTSVADSLRAARESLAHAAQLAQAVEHRRTELAEADAALERLRGEAQQAADEARALRDAPPDAESGAAVGAAVAALEAALAETRPKRGARRDPVAALDALVDASDELDIAVAAARNQQRRLDGARGALEGALVSARTQLAAVRDYIGGRRGSSGVDARTRLAEGERELLYAENESDPVAALDAARRAQTHARDADALARYRG